MILNNVSYLELKGKSYKLVNRKAKPGDVVIFISDQTLTTNFVTPFKPYEVVYLAEWNRIGFENDIYHKYQNKSNIYSVYLAIVGRTEETVLVYELVENYHLLGKSKNQLKDEFNFADDKWFTIEYGTYDECIAELKRTTAFNNDGSAMLYKLVKYGDVDLSKHAGTLFE